MLRVCPDLLFLLELKLEFLNSALVNSDFIGLTMAHH